MILFYLINRKQIYINMYETFTELSLTYVSEAIAVELLLLAVFCKRSDRKLQEDL